MTSKTTKYKYPELQKPFNLADTSRMSAEYNTLIPALGMVLLRHAMLHLNIEENKDTMHGEDLILQFAYCTCGSDFYDAMEIYSNI